MKVVKNDYRFATTSVSGVYHEFASASDCKSYGCNAARNGVFQVDLTGTNFRFKPTIPYKYFSYPNCAKKLFNPVMNANRQRWSARCGGRCGLCKSEYILLEFTG